MAVYHVNPETGEVGTCSATSGKCPFGGVEEHFATQVDARSHAEAILSDEYVLKPVSKPIGISREETQALINELHGVSVKYYQTGEESELSDEEFDAKLAFLQEEADSGRYPDLFEEGSRGFKLLESDPSLGTTSEDNDVLHTVPMLSLAKAKVERDLYSFLEKTRSAGAEGFRLQAKLDGLALAVEYSGGKLVRVSTRGDGTHGEDVTYVVKDPNVQVKGLELTISEQEPLEVRGELFFKNHQYKAADNARFAKTGVRFKNSRNAATGLLKAAKQGVDYPVEFTFAAYSVIKSGAHVDMDVIHKLGFESVDGLTDKSTPGLAITDLDSNEDVMNAVHAFGKIRPGFDYPTDGVVIKPSNEASMHDAMGSTSHHPASQVAWKYPAAKATTEVLAISVTVGRSGKVTPVAHTTPVELDGSTVSNASLHNFNLVHTKGIRVGSVVLIEKANEIIPQVVAVLSNPHDSVDMEVPNNCPACGATLSYDMDEKVWPPKTLRCVNDDCSSRNFFALKTAVGKNMLDIDGMGNSSIEYLNSIGRILTIADFYTLNEEELANSQLGLGSEDGRQAHRLGEKRAKNIIEHIEKSKTRPLRKMLPALSINLLGESATKALEKRFGDIDGILEATEEEIAELDKFGPKKASSIYNGLKNRRPLIDKMRSHGVTFGKGVEPTSSSEDSGSDSGALSLSGMSFAISGSVPPGFSNRNAWVDFVEAAGGEFHRGPKANTTYMIGDPSESSAKVKEAVKLKLTFMSPADFSSKFAQ